MFLLFGSQADVMHIWASPFLAVLTWMGRGGRASENRVKTALPVSSPMGVTHGNSVINVTFERASVESDSFSSKGSHDEEKGMDRGLPHPPSPQDRDSWTPQDTFAVAGVGMGPNRGKGQGRR